MPESCPRVPLKANYVYFIHISFIYAQLRRPVRLVLGDPGGQLRGRRPRAQRDAIGGVAAHPAAGRADGLPDGGARPAMPRHRHGAAPVPALRPRAAAGAGLAGSAAGAGAAGRCARGAADRGQCRQPGHLAGAGHDGLRSREPCLDGGGGRRRDPHRGVAAQRRRAGCGDHRRARGARLRPPSAGIDALCGRRQPGIRTTLFCQGRRRRHAGTGAEPRVQPEGRAAGALGTAPVPSARGNCAPHLAFAAGVCQRGSGGNGMGAACARCWRSI